MMVVPVALETSVQAHVQVSLAAAEAEGRQLVVYIGATWCEPCRRFHDAVKAGQLNDALAGVRFLEFDHDAHQEGLKVSGYLRRFVPLFAIPNPDGTASNRLHEGAIKGPGAVDFIVPRLKALLDDRSAAQPAL
jgi:thiol-disulfide isomerase/thioredoxin